MTGKSSAIHFFAVIMTFLGLAVSCSPEWKDEMIPGVSAPEHQEKQFEDREINTDTRKVLLLYSAGFNSLSNYLREDIDELCTGWIPRQRRADDVILVYSHLPVSRGNYDTRTSPVLFRIYSDIHGTVIRDTLVTYAPKTISASAKQFNEVLSYVNENFPAKSYGLLFSSHATGYLPNGFYSYPGSYKFNEGALRASGKGAMPQPSPVPYLEPEHDPAFPAVKSLGQTVDGALSYEMDIRDFADAIPMKLDYILFDACLMGGIEVAYELVGKCDRVGFSQAEVLAEGFNYATLASHLLGNKTTADPRKVCEDYFNQYDVQSGVYRSATISMVDCNKLEPMAATCRNLFTKYSENIKSIRPSEVQQFYRGSKHWFYDLQSILEKAGISAEEKMELSEALEGCIIYKNATPSFMGEFAIDTFSGFSMYLPSNGHVELNKYYKTLKWNQATGLVK